MKRDILYHDLGKKLFELQLLHKKEIDVRSCTEMRK